MILQALTDYYEVMAARGLAAPEGWCRAKANFALVLEEDGTLSGLMNLREQQADGAERPRVLTVPEQEKRTSGIVPHFLCDTASYLLGIDGKGNPERAKKCFAASAALHRRLLDKADNPAARAVCAFFDLWDPERASESPALEGREDELKQGGNLVFRFAGSLVHETEEIRALWQESRRDVSLPQGRCLVTGKVGPIARIHTSIQGVKGAQSSGAALVSFNAPAFESDGKAQNYNAPVSCEAAFAYTTALNALLADREHVWVLGDTTVVCWAKDGEPAYQDAFAAMINAGGEGDATTVFSAMDKLANGKFFDFEQIRLQPEMEFYILGLAPNAGRLAVRFFYRSTFGDLAKHYQEHYKRLDIVKPAYDSREHLSVWHLLRETVNSHSKETKVSPLLPAALFRSILEGTAYPAALLNGVWLRIRAEGEITRGRAAIIKAYWLKRKKDDSTMANEEVWTVKLNEECSYPPYVLGRIFRVLESIQQAASPGINATIKDRFFNSACATPAAVFSVLLRLKNSHMRVLNRDKKGLAVSYEKRLTELAGKLNETLPVRLNREEQSAFVLGYYHERQQQFATKEKEKED